MKIHTILGILTFSLLMIAAESLSHASPGIGDSVGVPVTGALGISRTTNEIMQRQRAEAARGIVRPPRIKFEHEIEREGLPQNPSSPEIDHYPQNGRIEKNQSLSQSILSPQTLGTTFLGAQLSDANAFPPDVMGAVGPTQYIVAINGRIRSFVKSTGTGDGVLNADMDVFFSSVMSTQSGTFTSDPRIRYDRLTGRWFVIMIDVPAGTGTIANRLLIAVSNTSTITGSTVWTYFYFIPNASQFADYPTLGIDKSALYIGFNMFTLSGNYAGTIGYVVRKSSILGSGPIVVTNLGSLAPASGAGVYTPQGADNFDTTATEGYFIGVDNASFGLLQMRRVSNPGGTPTVSSNLSITVPTTEYPLTVPHLGNTGGTNGNLDALDDRLFMAVARNGHIWIAHNIGVNSSGTTTSPTRDGSRWYDIGNISGTPTLVQAGTVYDNTSGARSYWIPSINVSGQGHAAMGFSIASSTERINAATVGRLATDASSTMQTPVVYTSSSTAYNPPSDPGGASGRRWGDYSYTSVDPDDDMTMWTIQEFCNASNSWGVQVVKLIAPPPAIPSSALPASVNRNVSNVNVTITGTSSGGSGFFDPGPAFPNRLTAGVNGGGVSINSVAYTDPTHVTLNITVAPDAATGARTVVVTNPDGQVATSLSGILTINDAGCPTITLSPTTLPSGSVGSTYGQTITASGGTAPYSFSITSGSLPPGITLSSGGLLSGTPTLNGTFGFTMAAADANTCTGNQVYSVTITGCPTISISPISLLNGSAGAVYSQSLTASGGTSPYTYTVTSGSLPTGVSLSSGGVLSGTPTSTGSFSFTVRATDATTCFGSQPYSLTIDCGTISIAPISLPSGSISTAYSQTFTASGGVSPYTYILASGLLPAGLSLSSSGLISGTPTITETSNFSVTVTDATSCSGTQAYSITITSGSSASTNLTVLGVPYSQDFNTLANSGTSSAKPSGWVFSESGSNANTTYSAGNGSSNAGDTWSFGATSSTERAFGGIQSSTLVPTIGAFFTNSTGSTITSLVVSYTGEEWRLGTANRYDTLKFQYSLDATGLTTGTWTVVPVLDYKTTDVTGTAGARDGNTIHTFISATISSLSIANAATFWIKWMDANATSSDDGLAVDDFALTPYGSAPTNPSVVGTATPATVSAGDATLLTASAASGTNPTSTGIAVTGDLTSIGGSATQPFYDDGTHGDVSAGDNVFSFQATVAPSTPVGAKSLPVSISDAQARTGSTTIALTVAAPPCPTISIAPSTLPNDTVGHIYSASLIASGGTPPYHYSITGGTLPTGTTLSPTGNLSGTLSAAGSYAFTATVADSNGCTGARAYSMNVYNLPITFSAHFNAHWNMISMPVSSSTDSVHSLFPDASSRLFSFTAGSYQQQDRISVGSGYWMKFPAAKEYSLVGLPLDSIAVDMSEGWNLVGSISTPIPASFTRSDPPNRITSPFYSFDGCYQSSDTVWPSLGYWVKVYEPCKLILSTLHGKVALPSTLGRIRIVPTADLPPAPPEPEKSEGEVALEFGLEQNYPNPFNPTTDVRYAICEVSFVSLKVFDVLGREVATLVNEIKQPGEYAMRWDASNVPSGFYFYRLQAGKFTDIKKMILMK